MSQNGNVALAPPKPRKHASSRTGPRGGERFILFAGIGGFIFVAGLALQAALTGLLHIPPVISYAIQTVVAVEASFVLNRWLTWRDRGTPFWVAFARFNVQKTVTAALTLVLYDGLLRLGVNYLIANVALAAVFTVINYVAGDRLVFTVGKETTPTASVSAATASPYPAFAAAPAASKPATAAYGRMEAAEPTALPAQAQARHAPSVSVIIPCRDSETTIRETVLSLLDQDYPALREVILVGSPSDRTWLGLGYIEDPRLIILEVETPPGRDANFKRDYGVRKTAGDLIALVDSDIVLPHDWMRRAVSGLQDSAIHCVAGHTKSIHDSFWGRYTDDTWIGAKTSRVSQSYVVTSANFGRRGQKPPTTANILFTRELYDAVPIDASWKHNYEDYEWFWRAVRAGYSILLCDDLFGWHHHRHSWRAQVKDYLHTAAGCAVFVRAHIDCPLAKRRLRQAVILPCAAVAGLLTAGAAAGTGYGDAVAALALVVGVVLAATHAARSHRLEGATYPAVGLVLGLVFTTGLVTNLMRPTAVSPTAVSPTVPERRRRPSVATRWLLIILAIQAGLSLRLVWSNTAFGDEALYLRVGHMEIASWLHGSSGSLSWFAANISGAPVVYPPLGALADSIGGLAGARLLSLVFMLGATGLLYATASRIFDRNVAIAAAAVFALLGNVQMLGAFATYDAMAVCLIALAAWLVVRAEGRLSEPLLVVAALVMTIANATKYASALWDPVIILLAVTTARSGGWVRSAARGLRLTFYFAAALATALWFGGPSYIAGITATTLNRTTVPGASTSPLYVLGSAFVWTGFILFLATLGTIFSFARAPWRVRLTCLVLTVAVILAPANQARIDTLTSLEKHVVFGAWFAAIVAGYALVQIVKYFQSTDRRNWFVVTPVAVAGMIMSELVYAVAVVVAIIWFFQAPGFFAWWPNISRAIPIIAATVRQDPGPCLMVENNVFGYYLPREIPSPVTCFDGWGFAYYDSARNKELTGNAAYAAAIRQHYFTVIEVDPYDDPSFYTPVNAAASAAGYSLVASLPNTALEHDRIMIWRYAPRRMQHVHRSRDRKPRHVHRSPDRKPRLTAYIYMPAAGVSLRSTRLWRSKSPR